MTFREFVVADIGSFHSLGFQCLENRGDFCCARDRADSVIKFERKEDVSRIRRVVPVAEFRDSAGMDR